MPDSWCLSGQRGDARHIISMRYGHAKEEGYRDALG
ncbi:MAG: hypothetical protein QOH67_1341 [Hyphomicrobiales bacterium]|nr:hypothetical protein [Hyphomicrobiales bacterium]